ncbi:hypothetical protein MJA45_13465 [Paenibacillus aurantius]|uniref:MFS transporter n=1 Tax=Paenibacillus aurantius TaxID=2918900 RepID=A0AA96LIN9_9BACL|nr:hypothetical protein [Paenibacillus aurantius]WNQ13980.1 hypothetical protein MJA45_13465 [Paenibacillus aurantius]
MGITSLSAGLRKILLMNVIGNVIFIYINLFVNLFIWEKNKQIGDLAWYHFILYLSWVIIFILSAHLLTKRSIRMLVVLAAICGFAAFLVLQLAPFSDRPLMFISSFAVPCGFMFGFFYAANNLSITQLSKDKEQFTHFMALANIINHLVSMTVPLGSALIIEHFSYKGSFVLMLMIVGLLLAVSLGLPKITLQGVFHLEDALYRRAAWVKLMANPPGVWLQLSFAAAGIFYMFQGLFVLVFTFSVTGSKLTIGLLNAGYMLAAAIANFIYRRTRGKEQVWMIVSILFIGAGFLISLFPAAFILILSIS